MGEQKITQRSLDSVKGQAQGEIILPRAITWDGGAGRSAHQVRTGRTITCMWSVENQ